MNTSNLDWCYTAFILAAIAWIIFAHPPRHLSQREYGTWYRTRYLNGWYWRTFRRFRRVVGLGLCEDWWKVWRGRCSGPLHVHHKKFAYRWLYWEFLIWPFGTDLLCDRHHRQRHK